MNKLILLTTTAVVLLGIVVFLYSQNTVETPTPTMRVIPDSFPNGGGPGGLPAPSLAPGITVTYSDSGYSPSVITIKKGEVITFDNKGTQLMWTASAVHPTHKAYPDSGIEKCGEQDQTSNFDSCKGYEPGKLWKFSFNESGTWKYHNHLQANHTGTIIVE